MNLLKWPQNKKALEELNKLMKQTLDNNYSSCEREEYFSKMYNLYLEKDSSGENWMNTYNKIRNKYANRFTSKQLKKYGLTNQDLKKSFLYLKKRGIKFSKKLNLIRFCIGYSTIYSLLKRVSNGNKSILEIGYGEYPFLIKILNKEGFSCKGIEPTEKKPNNKNTFNSKIQTIPRKLIKRYDIVIAVLVFSANYMNYFKKRFKWERENKVKILRLLSRLIKSDGYLILKDDIGSIFTKKELSKQFRIIFFEKDTPLLEFTPKLKNHGLFKLTLLKKRYSRRGIKNE